MKLRNSECVRHNEKVDDGVKVVDKKNNNYF